MKRTMTFKDWSAQRAYHADLGLVVPGLRQPGDEDIPTPGLAYPHGYYIQHWVDARHGASPKGGIPCYILTLTSSELIDTDLVALERRLYEYARGEGGCEEEVPDLTPGQVFDFVAGCIEMGVDGSPQADAGHELSLHRQRTFTMPSGSMLHSFVLMVDGREYAVAVRSPELVR